MDLKYYFFFKYCAIYIRYVSSNLHVIISAKPYEHVKIYQQPPDRKRPIVLVGPRNVGRYELRDKLTSDEPHLFTVPIAHTSRPLRDNEVQGQDYYFVEKAAFESHKAVSIMELGTMCLE